MSVFTPVGILIFSALIAVLLQLVPGVFVIFRHYTSGKFSSGKASILATFFIFGVETVTALLLLSLYFICSSPILPLALNNRIFSCIMAGILIALGLLFFFCYFRKGPGTRLFISRKIAADYTRQSRSVKSRSDAFLFGVASTLPELIFTLPLYLLSILAVAAISPSTLTCSFIIILFAIATVVPLLILHGLSRTHTTADFIKSRFKSKAFYRFFIPLLYFLIAILIIFGV